ncbi:NAD(P)-dependent dehydrogenase (short-subunit alcohol dehydrogenase family) [Algoriphagus ratkowskyi]|uniref:NAD(P)-dependent dehydrogenase (Short-subunit alcohol dehydrogenase family) n=1 Tax=Algoriphagus ratkowskyi TaxID=57028 RepID=A0A2W7RH71_9BACT|nr:SDR family oxidoreductase [Algoriphagus ratkowskyi]PZX60268.1 NAD(P)-dependent dehydrogenase (short-subunit alcohol dehydrogenase family) [Algoriphagus ratkowskyi]TXD78086.1 SDR family oxidoreductase [Algoriphagus ratkowskyi]
MKPKKTAIITGAGQGIGLAIAEKLAAQSVNLILNDLEEGLITEACKRISHVHGVSALAVPGDASSEQVIDEMINTALSNFGTVDIVIANSGITLFGAFLDYNRADFMEVTRVNQAGTFFLAQAAARVMKDQSSGGALLFTSSVTAHQSHENLAAYAMSKAALEMLAKNLVLELAPFKIRVNTIAPGATVTNRTTMDPDYEKTWSKITPLGTPAVAQDIANAAAFLVSDEARHITGQTLIIDGGWTSVSPSPYA